MQHWRIASNTDAQRASWYPCSEDWDAVLVNWEVDLGILVLRMELGIRGVVDWEVYLGILVLRMELGIRGVVDWEVYLGNLFWVWQGGIGVV
jgi:hypothetical protein